MNGEVNGNRGCLKTKDDLYCNIYHKNIREISRTISPNRVTVVNHSLQLSLKANLFE